ncbi:HPP family protein [Paraburkholderia domus]|nr:HPP family protein [Paraburkholderia domus]MBK5051301.1 HPP family protein [Burkholderia sp. R-70006]MBK5061561.1 HPP family protein [Burkholderia sp. R-70199]MBK5088364.1 HPP family protein [Burkholderia sp. R-69927]MBK5122761.1 HPP family protein [Burkholderia sp. R-69980]MBK5165371.1 HPP family protein [Burkholderia sp. R-70211]MBK5185880.1 HPP family protein [Burkholderia sp. R-69749]MCI0148359.1 HPP family protein [Paraburkholderia sediminicola]
MSRYALIRWLSSFAPHPIAVRWPERFRSCLGALLGIAFTGGTMHLLLGPAANIPLLVAPMGASAVLLFAVPASPLAQPWSIIGGNIVSATVGVACASLIVEPVGAAALAVAMAICAMFALRCVHPPSGAVALTAVLGGPAVHALGYRFVAEPIAIQSVALLCAAILYHAATGHRYPHVAQSSGKGTAAPAAAAANEGFTRADLEAVLNRRGELLDIDTDDLESLLRDVQLQAYARTFNELTCADIMSRSLVAVSAVTRASAAWSLLKQRHIKALPVTDEKQHVIGIVTRADLVDKRAFSKGAGLTSPVQRWFRRSITPAPLVGALMNVEVRTVDATTPIVELVPVFANYGHHHIPVLDSNRRLAGMITQADLITGLYRQAYAQQRRAA